MQDIIAFIEANGAEIFQALAAIVAAASVFANFTKTDADNRALGAVARVVNFLAANFFALKARK